jgi:hypothetical protein
MSRDQAAAAAFPTRSSDDRVELLDRVRIDITDPQRCETFLGQRRIIADIPE